MSAVMFYDLHFIILCRNILLWAIRIQFIGHYHCWNINRDIIELIFTKARIIVHFNLFAYSDYLQKQVSSDGPPRRSAGGLSL